MGYGEKRDIDISYMGIYGFHLSCAFSAASLLFNLKRNFCLATAPRGSRFLRKPAPCGRGGCSAPLAALGGYRSFCSRAPQGDTSPAPNPRIGRNGSRFEKKNSGLTRGVLTKFRLAQAPRGSRFLRKPAPCGRGGCAAPLAALGGYRSFCSRSPQGKSIRPNITPQWKKPCRSPRGARR